MIYKFHTSKNSNSILNTLGWLSIVIAVTMFFATNGPSPILLLLIGGSIIWLTSKKKIYKVDTEIKELQLDDSYSYSIPEKILITIGKESQVVNSRVQTTTVYTSYYFGYFVADGEHHMISKNKKLETDLKTLLALGEELSIPVEQTF